MDSDKVLSFRGLVVRVTNGEIMASDVFELASGEKIENIAGLFLRIGADPSDVQLDVVRVDSRVGGRYVLESLRGKEVTLTLQVGERYVEEIRHPTFPDAPPDPRAPKP